MSVSQPIKARARRTKRSCQGRNCTTSDPAMIMAGPDAKAETIAAIRLELGLDRSIPVQFFEYILRVMRGDLGRSIISNRMVSQELAMTTAPTVELMLGARRIVTPTG